jgi:vancomycin resistance protein VanW
VRRRKPGRTPLVLVAAAMTAAVVAAVAITTAAGAGRTSLPRKPSGQAQQPAPPASPALDPQLARLLAEHNLPDLIATFDTDLSFRLPGEAENIAIGARRLAASVVRPGEVFSLNGVAGPYTTANGYGLGPTYVGARIVRTEGGGVCQIATTLFNAVILADLEPVQRHTHTLTVPYVPPGQDATVTDGRKDFRFRNNRAHSVLIWAEVKGRYERLSISLYGRGPAPKVAWHHRQLARRSFETTVTGDQSLPAGVEEVDAPGQDGVTVNSWVVVESPDGTTHVHHFGVHTYLPSPRLVRRGGGR